MTDDTNRTTWSTNKDNARFSTTFSTPNSDETARIQRRHTGQLHPQEPKGQEERPID